MANCIYNSHKRPLWALGLNVLYMHDNHWRVAPKILKNCYFYQIVRGIVTKAQNLPMANFSQITEKITRLMFRT